MKGEHVYHKLFTLTFLITLTACGAGLSRITLAPAERDQLKYQPEIAAINYQPVPNLPVKSLGGGYDLVFGATGQTSLEDPVLRVKERFLHSLAQEIGLTNIRSIDKTFYSPHDPATGAELSPLQNALRKGLVIDFDTIAWQLVFVRRSFISPGKTTYGIDYSVRARLIRLDDATILWQGICVITRDRDPRTWDELTGNDNALLITKRLETADACAAELLDYFVGRAEWSAWSGRKEVKQTDKK